MKPELMDNSTVKHFRETLSPHVNLDDCMAFYANRSASGKSTYLDLEIYQNEKLATIVMEQYAVRSKLQGNVIMAIPKPEFGMPIFSYQLGGNGTQTIGLLDISPIGANIDYSQIKPICEKYRDKLGLEPSKLDWVNRMYSPYHLHCHYDAMDEALFQEAMFEYLEVWIEQFYKPAIALEDQDDIRIASVAILEFKRVLHDNDPAHGIFAKSWGRPVADAFLYLETRDHPALVMETTPEEELILWKNTDLNVSWTKEAQERVMEAPETVHQIIRDVIENNVAEANINLITLEVFDQYKEVPDD